MGLCVAVATAWLRVGVASCEGKQFVSHILEAPFVFILPLFTVKPQKSKTKTIDEEIVRAVFN